MTTQDGTLDLGPPAIRWRRYGVAAAERRPPQIEHAVLGAHCSCALMR